MGGPCEPRSLIFLWKYNEMGAGQLSVPPVHELLEHFIALDGETDSDSGVLGVKNLFILCAWGWKIGEFN